MFCALCCALGIFFFCLCFFTSFQEWVSVCISPQFVQAAPMLESWPRASVVVRDGSTLFFMIIFYMGLVASHWSSPFGRRALVREQMRLDFKRDQKRGTAA
nr:hypothetical protein [Pandoravirus massiliensis]